MLTKFYKVTEPKTLAAIREQIDLRSSIRYSYFEKKEQFKAEAFQFTDTIRFGMNFQGLLFKSPADFDHKLFKFTVEKNANGLNYLCLPRKANKKFYAEFMESIKAFSYRALLKTLFGDHYASIGFISKAPEAFYFTVKGVDPICDCIEITGSEYELASVDCEE